MAQPRRPLPVKLTEEAHTGLDTLATHGRVTKTAMIEALGLFGAEGRPIVWGEVIAEARRIDIERLSRRPGRG